MQSPSRLLAQPSIAAVCALVMTLSTVCLFAPRVEADANSTPDETVRTIKVDLADLDLTTDAGNQALYARLQRAAAQVCRNDDRRDLAARRETDRCKRAALMHAVERIGSAKLAALVVRAAVG